MPTRRSASTTNVVRVAVAVGLAGLVMSSGALPGRAAADPATPVSLQCTTPPRAVDAFVALAAATPPAVSAPIAPPTGAGKPADAAVVTGVTETVNQLTACTAAGEVLRVLALFSDDAALRMFSGGGETADSARARYTELATPSPMPNASDITPLPVSDVQTWADNRVSALAGTGADRSLVWFVKGPDRWLIDDLEAAPDIATPTP